MSIGDRIKEVRKSSGLTQQLFSDRIKLKRQTIAAYEIGAVAPSDRTIIDICHEFNVSEHWLRTGEGEMFVPLSRDEEIAAFMGDVMAGETGDFRRRLISALSRLNVEEWEALEKLAIELAKETKRD